jgi:hypothetical protein
LISLSCSAAMMVPRSGRFSLRGLFNFLLRG